MITADPKSPLGYWCRKVDDMKPGQFLEVCVRDLDDIASYEHKNAMFTPPDRILGNIVGSAFTHSYWLKPDGRTVVFVRHEDTGERRHEDPDRRQYMQQPVFDAPVASTEQSRKRAERAAWFDANEHRMIDRVSGLPRGHNDGH